MSEPVPQRRLAKAIASLEDLPDLLVRLDAVRQAREALERLEAETARQARDSGVTWGQIGGLYGVSKQAAQQRFRGVAKPPKSRRPPAVPDQVAPDQD